jgi:hypothetical protein
MVRGTFVFLVWGGGLLERGGLLEKGRGLLYRKKNIFQIEIIALLACFACVEYSPDGIYLSWVIVAASLIGILADSIYMLFGYAEIASFVSDFNNFFSQKN